MNDGYSSLSIVVLASNARESARLIPQGVTPTATLGCLYVNRSP